MTRIFDMPSADTLSVPAIRQWASSWLVGREVIVDPFARNSRMGTLRNDLDPETTAESHDDAEAFCVRLAAEGVVADAAIFDPPYSPRQISECYAKVGLTVGMAETQNARLYRRVRDALDKIVRPGGVVLSFGWNSAGMGVGRGYKMVAMLAVNHGGAHNDTICVAEIKIEPAQMEMIA